MPNRRLLYIIIFLCQAFFLSGVFREKKSLIGNASISPFSEGEGEGNHSGIIGKSALDYRRNATACPTLETEKRRRKRTKGSGFR